VSAETLRERVASFLVARFRVPIQWADVDALLAVVADDTREALAAMVREGKAAGMYADDHGAAGFCTDHGHAALDVDAIRARADSMTKGDDPVYFAGTPVADVYALLAEVERLRGSADAWWGEYDKALTETGRLLRIINGYDRTPAEARAKAAEDALAARDAEVERLTEESVRLNTWHQIDRLLHESLLAERDALLAEVLRLRAVGPIAWTFGQQARADRAEATVARVEAAAATAIDTLARMRLTSVAIGHGSCAEAQQEAIEHLRAGLRPLPRERYDAVLDSGLADEDEGADCG